MPASSIHYLTPPMPVSMGDAWFEIASAEHFWMIRRFEVLRFLAEEVIRSSRHAGEIGCGNGVLQAQFETAFGRELDGFDLNEHALRLSVAKHSPLFCYDIHERRAELREKYDLLFLFDIIEHIDDEDRFLESALHHLAPGGHLVINVPALQWLYSAYDRAAGHVRRYTTGMISTLAARHQLEIGALTYWGFPMLPLLVIRKMMLALRKRSDAEVLHSGFKPPSGGWNDLLAGLSRLETLPQNVAGSSVMAVLKKPN